MSFAHVRSRPTGAQTDVRLAALAWRWKTHNATPTSRATARIHGDIIVILCDPQVYNDESRICDPHQTHLATNSSTTLLHSQLILTSMSHSSGAMMSNVGNPQVYNDGDQRYVFCACVHTSVTILRHPLRPSKKEIEEAQNHPAYHAGEKHSHQDLDSKYALKHSTTFRALT